VRLPTRRGIAARIDLARSTGLTHALRRWRRDRRFAPLAEARRRHITRSLWKEAAAEAGADLAEVAPLRFELCRGAAVTKVSGQTVELNDADAVGRARDKAHVFRLLADAHVRIPEHHLFRAHDVAGALAFLERTALPCVVKPACGSGGDGVTGFVCNANQLRRAARAASRFAPSLLIERQAEGDVFRLLVLDDEVLDVVVRRAPTVIGDGRSTIEELMFREDDRRLGADGDPGLKPFAVDLDSLLTLEWQGLTLRSVPQDGASVRVKSVTNFNRVVDNERVRHVVSNGLCDVALAAARTAGLRLAGVDAVGDPAGADVVVIDVNPVPALHHHLHVVNPGASSRVAAPILRALLPAR
jgi:D-alanine-D-alanine ligase-like ATP-grasp enzyme